MTINYQWQMYWPGWYRLWPSYNKTYDKDFDLHVNWFCFGSFQIRWYSNAS